MKKGILMVITGMFLMIMTVCSEVYGSKEFHINSGGTGIKSSQVSSSSASSSLINNDVAENNIANSLAIVQRATGQEVGTVLSGTNKPGVALVKVSELSDVTGFLALCVNQKVIPTLQITSNAEADLVIAAMTSSGCTDVTVVSDNASALAYVRENKNIVRTGLIVELAKSNLTSKEANEIRKKVRSAPATFCIIKSDNASRQAVAELQELAVAVWVEVSARADSDEFTIETLKALTSGANGVISCDAAKVTETINNYMEKNTMTRAPLIIGHRAAPNLARENTISSLLAAHANGADIAEIDVDFTLDGEVILMHDETIRRTTNYKGTKKISEMTLAEIKQYNIRDNNFKLTDEKVPTLEEVFEALKDNDLRLFIELKDSDTANISRNVAKVVAIIKEYGMEDRVNFISFNHTYLRETQENLPGISIGVLSWPDGDSATRELALNNFANLIGAAQNLGGTINSTGAITSKYFSQVATERGITTWPYTYDKTSNNEAFFNGSDGITTDDPQWAKDMSKYIEAVKSNMEVEEGKTLSATVKSITYGGASNTINTNALIIKVLDGEEYITVSNGKISGISIGTAVVMFGYKTKTTDGSDYVLYTQPVTVSVKEEGSIVDPGEDDNQGTTTPGEGDAGNTGGSTGNTGGNSSGNTGGSTGNTGGNSSGNTGGSTGNTGDNTGDAGNNTDNNTGSQSPETGDKSSRILVMCYTLICGCLVAGLFFYKKNKQA